MAHHFNTYIIGAGGVGSILAPVISRIEPRTIVVDGDKLELKNLDRQLFDKSDIGRNKAEALSEKYHVEAMPEWYYDGLIEHNASDVLIGCVDNMPARRSILKACDLYGCRAIIAGNETTSADAYYYEHSMEGGPCDPRVMFPEILSDNSDDPRARSIGCTGVAQTLNRQLVTANLAAAGLAGHLFVVWILEAPKLDKEVLPRLPHLLRINLSRMEHRTVEQTMKGQYEKTN